MEKKMGEFDSQSQGLMMPVAASDNAMNKSEENIIAGSPKHQNPHHRESMIAIKSASLGDESSHGNLQVASNDQDRQSDIKSLSQHGISEAVMT